ncbi:hypothetical protein [Paraburkholderia strydomiana]|uniref:hypothetical protein n=1 Tax=Paraburkholderia strydomiana TaxID=1245417 RepID=UPI001BEAB2D4|nr:hypothetical protein [Paraburkholderia strydomiana]MBT2791071.1 hypothetical protein [Paraburkholderia strydomiana]
MNRDYLAKAEPLLPMSGRWHCRSMRGFMMLMVHERSVGPPQVTADALRQSKAGPSSLADDVARAFQKEKGRSTSAISLTPALDAKLERARFLAMRGAAAAVLVLDVHERSRSWPPCDWEGPLLRVGNRLADEGSRLFVALATPVETRGVRSVLRRARTRTVVHRIGRFCSHEGIGYLDLVSEAPERVSLAVADSFQERIAIGVADKLASARFFCCDAFRVGPAPATTWAR